MPCQTSAATTEECTHTFVADSEELILKTFGTSAENLPFRARQKATTDAYMSALLSLPRYNREHNPHPSRNEMSAFNQYTRTLDCCTVTREAFAADPQKAELRFVSSFCKNRFCIQCNRIRQFVNTGLYSELFNEKLYFLTLTRRNVVATDLEAEIKALSDVFRNIQHDKIRERRGNRKGAMGLRKIEVTYNADRDDFHPHLHLLVTDREKAECIVDEWMNHAQNVGKVSRLAQDWREANDEAKFELLKYTSKIVTSSKSKPVYVDALDTINRAMIGKRSLQPFGFKISKEKEDEGERAELVQYGKPYEWNEDLRDWVHYQHYEVTEYQKVVSHHSNDLMEWEKTETLPKVTKRTKRTKLHNQTIKPPQINFQYD